MKRCCTCKEEKPLDGFGADRSREDGLQARCKACRNQYASKAYAEKPKAPKTDIMRPRGQTRLETAQWVLENDVEEDGDHGCLILTKYRQSTGYGQVKTSRAAEGGRKAVSTHRLIYEEIVCGGDTPSENFVVHHTCGRGADGCVNPDHLQAVTPIENVAEMLERQAYIDEIAALKARVAELEAQLKQVT